MTKKISLIKILMFFVCTAFILSGCRQELLKDDEEKFNPNSSRFQVMKLADIPNVAKYIKSKTGRSDLKLPIVNSQFALSKGNIDFANLESSTIIKKTDGDNVYYVFSIENAGDEKTIYTYEVKEVREEIIKSEFIEYASDVPYGDRPFEVLNGFTGKVISYDLEGNQISVNSFLDGDSGCPPNGGSTGGSSGGTTTPGNGGPTFPGGGWVGGGFGGSGGSGGSSGNPTDDCGEWVFSHHTYDSSTNVTGYIYTNDCGETRWEEVEYVLTPNANKTALTADCNDGSGIIVLPIKNGTPCDRINAITSNQMFQDNITALAGMTNYSSERGYRMDYASSTSSNPGGINNQFLQNKPGTNQIEFKYFLPSTFAIIHTHYDSLNDPIFSPGDIIQFNAWLVAAKNWNANPANNPKIDLKNLSYTLVTSWGTYTLTFDGTDVVPFSGYNIDNLNTEYINNVILPVMTVANVSGDVSFNMDKLEEGFLRFAAANLNMPGMKLFKLGSDGNTEIFLNNNIRVTNKCN
ncbi:hypothetical protein [Chryseobacterium defluvii]|uniref:Uncharacterized protein n=1 Tax=Chryseobacterium defluvii TaxID=160396 RepID=A0A495SQ59_9FLAO|nr:hypothetical protein [Chryseobacterium defluvii]RKT01632.1 hypothetical protein BCF58_0855 [Chryseobacterium defluvii]